jgi:hypothetical protein
MELRGRKLASLGISRKEPKTVIRGRIQNLSQGGVCFLSNRSIPVSSLVLCEIVVSGTRVAIPTLMQVRWTERNPTSGRTNIGLQFLL